MRNLLIGLAFIAFGAFRGYQQQWLPMALYLCVGIGFSLMYAVTEERFSKYKKGLDIASWIFIGAAVFLFIAVLRSDAYGW